MKNPASLALALGLALTGPALLAAPRKGKPAARPAAKPSVAARQARPPASPPMSPEEARRTVAMLDDAYQITLHAVHDWYPTRTGQPVVAATVVRKLQERMAELGWPRSHFLAVNALVMNPDHRPRDSFEKDAITALRSGDERYEKVVGSNLRVATALPLGGGCFSCHWSDAKIGSRAAISFEIPLQAREARQ